WSPGNPQHPSLHLGWPMLESLSYSALLFNEQVDFDLATIFFESLTRYWQLWAQAPPVSAYNASAYSSITMSPFQYPGSESKVLGNILMWGRVHMAVRAYFEGWL